MTNQKMNDTRVIFLASIMQSMHMQFQGIPGRNCIIQLTLHAQEHMADDINIWPLPPSELAAYRRKVPKKFQKITAKE